MKAFRNIDMRDEKTKLCLCLAGGRRPYTACAFYKHKKNEQFAICTHIDVNRLCQRDTKPAKTGGGDNGGV